MCCIQWTVTELYFRERTWRGFLKREAVHWDSLLGSKLTPSNIMKMKRNRSLNTTNVLLAKTESSYVTTCFGLHLWPKSVYSLVVLRVCIHYAPLPDRNANEFSQHEFTPHHRTKGIHTTSFLHQMIATRYATTVLYHFSIHLSKPGQHSTHSISYYVH
jgi:hypothetical protein